MKELDISTKNNTSLNKEGKLCIRLAYCCSLERCKNCPKSCIKNKIKCYHWNTCKQFKEGIPIEIKCDKCKKIISLFTKVSKDDSIYCSDLDMEDDDIMETVMIRGFSKDGSSQFLFCEDCFKKMMHSNLGVDVQ